ncbi:unnamed protein product, partial [Meganyctiphanes norvegica]
GEKNTNNRIGFENKIRNRESQNRESSNEEKWGLANMGVDGDREKEGYGPAGEESSFSTSASYETAGRESGSPGELSELGGGQGSGERGSRNGSKEKSEIERSSESRWKSEHDWRSGNEHEINSIENSRESEKEKEQEINHRRDLSEKRIKNKEMNNSKHDKGTRKGDSSDKHGENADRKWENKSEEISRKDSTNGSEEKAGGETESGESNNDSEEAHDNKSENDLEQTKEDTWIASREKSFGATINISEKTSEESGNDSREDTDKRNSHYGSVETINSRSEEKDNEESKESKSSSKESVSESESQHGGEYGNDEGINSSNNGSNEKTKDHSEYKSRESEDNSRIKKASGKRKYRKTPSLPKKTMMHKSEQHKPAKKHLACYNCIGTDCKMIDHTTEADTSDNFVSCYTGHYVDGSSDIIFRGGEVQAHKDGECLKKGHKTICYCNKNLCNNKLWDDLKQTASFYKKGKKHQ